LGNIIVKPVHDFIDGQEGVGKNKVGAKVQDIVCLESFAGFPMPGLVVTEIIEIGFTKNFRFNKPLNMD
jgi:hypothetical protein